MKRFKIIVIATLSAALFLVASCTVKRDCMGRIKHKLPNGIWI